MDATNVLAVSLESPAGPAEEERALVLAARKNANAADQLFDKYYPEIFRYLFHSTHDRAVTEDLTSNVFLAAFRHLGLFRWRRVPFRRWLYRIATNELRMHYRRQRRLLAVQAGPVDPEHPEDVPGAGAELAARDDWRVLHGALIQLDEKYRTVLLLRYFEDRSLSEICEITNKREGTVKSLLHRALNRLRETLTGAGLTLP